MLKVSLFSAEQLVCYIVNFTECVFHVLAITGGLAMVKSSKISILLNVLMFCFSLSCA